MEETEFKGEKALQISSDVVDKDDKTVGKLKMIFLVTTESVSMVGVIAHESDQDLQKTMDTIINSFEVK